jgi:hypothetical protein
VDATAKRNAAIQFIGRWALICALVTSANCWAQTAVTITAHTGSPGTTIPRDFIGLSTETGDLNGSFKTSTGLPFSNPVFQRLISQIGPGVLRISGDSVDFLTGWMRGQRTAATPKTVLTSSDIDPAFAFARTVGWRVLWGLNLGKGDPASDADEAAYVYQTAGDVLLALQIGNEPDDYATQGLRPSTYTVNDYIAEWQTYAAAIQSQTRDAVFSGPDSSAGITTWTAACASQLGSRIAMLTQHVYLLAPLSTNPSASRAATIPNLMGAALVATENKDGSELQQMAQAQKILWRMDETNSSDQGGGQTGVSDVFAAALWGVDYMFTLAGNGAAGVNFYGVGGIGVNTPIAIDGNQITAHPLYYALLMFRAAAEGRLVPLDVAANGVNLTAYGVLDEDDTLRVTVINKDLTQNAALSIAPGNGYTTASVMRLTAPAITSATGITLGGAAVAADGSWSPAQLENGEVSGGTFHTTVSAGSAALVTLSNAGARRGRCRGGCASRMMSKAGL